MIYRTIVIVLVEVKFTSNNGFHLILNFAP